MASDGWLREKETLWPGQQFSLQVKKNLFHKHSDFQEVEVYESVSYGNVLVLDGVIQCTERDEASYQEMITHLPLCSLKEPPQRVLVVGGGDGGVVRELTRYPSIQKIDIAEIDKMVIDVSKIYLKDMSQGFSDPRVAVHICDGTEFVKNAQESWYDAIIVDSSDPVGPAKVLFQQPFFEAMHDAVRPGGIVCSQAECLWLHLDLISAQAKLCSSVFAGGSISYATVGVPTYPCGQIGFMLCAKKEEKSSSSPVYPPKPTGQYFNTQQQKAKLKFYNESLHSASFVLPQFALDALSHYLTFQK